MKFKDYINLFLSKVNLELRRRYPYSATAKAKDYFNGREIIACEVGVAEGWNAKSMLKELNIKKLYLIDPYEPDFKENNERNKAISARHMSKHTREGRVEFIYKRSGDVKELPTCDYIFIDGSHSKEDCLADLKNYWKYVKKGGLLAGHDFGLDGVTKAVIEFGKPFSTAPLHRGGTPCYWIVKE